MKPPRAPRSREELALLAARIARARFRNPALVDVAIQHDDHCPLLSGASFCVCAVEFVFTEITAP